MSASPLVAPRRALLTGSRVAPGLALARVIPLVGILVGALGGVARADETFEAKAAGAVHVEHLDALVWSLTAACDAPDDVEARQCRQLRDARAAAFAGATLLVDADPGAFKLGAWDAARHVVPYALSTCIDCRGVDVGGTTWFLTGGTGAPAVQGGAVHAKPLAEQTRLFGDEAATRPWMALARHARVEMLVKVPAHPRWTSGGASGLGLEIVGYRVISPCDGKILLAQPASGAVAADPRQCAPAGGKAASGDAATAAGGDAARVPALTTSMVREALAPVLAKVKGCGDKLAVRGTGTLRIVISGDGAILGSEMQGALGKTPAAACILGALDGVTFPPSQKERTTIGYPILLR